MLLSEADAVMVGGSPVDRVLCNGEQIWPSTTANPLADATVTQDFRVLTEFPAGYFARSGGSWFDLADFTFTSEGLEYPVPRFDAGGFHNWCYAVELHFPADIYGLDMMSGYATVHHFTVKPSPFTDDGKGMLLSVGGSLVHDKFVNWDAEAYWFVRTPHPSFVQQSAYVASEYEGPPDYPSAPSDAYDLAAGFTQPPLTEYVSVMWHTPTGTKAYLASNLGLAHLVTQDYVGQSDYSASTDLTLELAATYDVSIYFGTPVNDFSLLTDGPYCVVKGVYAFDRPMVDAAEAAGIADFLLGSP